MSIRLIEPMGYAARAFVRSVMLPQLIGRSLVMAPRKAPPSGAGPYADDAAFWRDILDESLGAERDIELRGMRLFEWFHRSPGLFHTPGARQAREEAQNHLRHMELADFTTFYENADVPPDHAGIIRRASGHSAPTRAQVFTPRGKRSMLEGGI